MISLIIDAAVKPLLRTGDASRLRRTCQRMVTAAARKAGAGALEASFRFTDEASIWALNRDYRDKDKPTDVLAFAVREGVGGHLVGGELGDVVVCLPIAKAQAKFKSHAGFLREVEYLAAHGLCHLLGYDHPTAKQEAVMNARMAALLAMAATSGRVGSA